MNKTVVITGASSGIGKETARLFAGQGYKVFATARQIERMQDLAALGCVTLRMDVTDETSMQQATRQILNQTDHIDVLVNNAGFSQNGFVEELTPEQMRYQFEVNVFGLIRVTQLLLPIMRANQNGRIINVGSVGGDFTTAGASAYHASKYAIESFSDGMRQELSPFGIQVVLVKPGGVETDFVKNAPFPEPIKGNPYGRMRDKFTNMLATILDANNSSFPILKPIEVASAIYKGATDSKPKTRIRVGRTAKMMPLIKRFMSDKAFDSMIVKQLGLAD